MNTTSFQSTGYNHAQQSKILGSSGLKIMQGEDLTYGDRKRMQQLQANQWYKQQMDEKQRRKNQEKQEKEAYDQQTLQIGQYRAELEKEKALRLTQMEQAYRNYNQEQLQEKLNKQALQRKLDDEERRNHIDYVTGNDFFTENAQTCQSELGKNRVKPYHWKGMSDDQKNDIKQEQEKQRREKQMLKQLQKQEEKLFADQQQAQRKVIILQDRAKNRGHKNMRKGIDQYNIMKAEEMKRKAYHAYDHTQTYKNEA